MFRFNEQFQSNQFLNLLIDSIKIKGVDKEPHVEGCFLLTLIFCLDVSVCLEDKINEKTMKYVKKVSIIGTCINGIIVDIIMDFADLNKDSSVNSQVFIFRAYLLEF